MHGSRSFAYSTQGNFLCLNYCQPVSTSSCTFIPSLPMCSQSFLYCLRQLATFSFKWAAIDSTLWLGYAPQLGFPLNSRFFRHLFFPAPFVFDLFRWTICYLFQSKPSHVSSEYKRRCIQPFALFDCLLYFSVPCKGQRIVICRHLVTNKGGF